MKKLVGALDILITVLGYILILLAMYDIYKPLGYLTAGIILALPDLITMYSSPRKDVK